MASVAVIQGGGGAIGAQFARTLLRNSSLHVVATSRDTNAAKRLILEGGGVDESRLTLLPMDVMDERTIERAAKDVEERYGKASLRMLVNVSGVVRPILVPIASLDTYDGSPAACRQIHHAGQDGRAPTLVPSQSPSLERSPCPHLTRCLIPDQYIRPPLDVQALHASPATHS